MLKGIVVAAPLALIAWAGLMNAAIRIVRLL